MKPTMDLSHFTLGPETERKSRRKSMNDIRTARAIDDDESFRRRGSIDDAVTKCLHAPKLSQKIKHAISGRTIAFSEVGDPSGAAVFVCVGMGLTRYVTAFYDELATTLRLRLITLDRPGVGGSEPYPPADKTGPLNWPEDVLTVCQHLGIIKFSILAHSAGAIYALATSLILPHLIQGKVHLLAPWIPPSQLEAISHPTASAPPANPLPRSQRLLRVLPTPFLKVANSSFMMVTSTSLQAASKRSTRPNAAQTQRRASGPIEAPPSPIGQDQQESLPRESLMLMDQFMPNVHPLDHYPLPIKPLGDTRMPKRGSYAPLTVSTDPDFARAKAEFYAARHTQQEREMAYASRLTQMTWDLATRDSNPATDLLVCLERNRDVGFRYTDVGVGVAITHGSEDKRVPLANVKWLGEQMNRRAFGLDCRATGLQGQSQVSLTNSGGCEVRILEGQGHGLMASPAIMSDVLTEIAGYWVGQDKGRLE